MATRKAMSPWERAYKLLAKYPEVAEMCRHDYSNSYIVKFGHVSAATVTKIRRALALTEGNYGSHRPTFDYGW